MCNGIQAQLDAVTRGAAPIPMILYCPICGAQHVDAPEPENNWSNPPHKSHKCHCCESIWRPADVCTVGVDRIATQGAADTPIAADHDWRALYEETRMAFLILQASGDTKTLKSYMDRALKAESDLLALQLEHGRVREAAEGVAPQTFTDGPCWCSCVDTGFEGRCHDREHCRKMKAALSSPSSSAAVVEAMRVIAEFAENSMLGGDEHIKSALRTLGLA
jgi:hypothetical protein